MWSDAEIGALLGDDADIVRRRFGIEADGNAPADPQGEFTGMNNPLYRRWRVGHRIGNGAQR